MTARSRRRHRGEAGYVAIVGALFIASLGMGCAALGVDIARLYLEGAQVQKVADIASLGAVTYLPQDLPSAVTDAKAIAARNGYDDADANVSVTVKLGDTNSKLDVIVCSKVRNSFASIFGLNFATVCRNAVADYSGPAPMGSPCNTFGNEPTSGVSTATPVAGPGGAKNAAGSDGTSQGASPFPNCSPNPSFWGTIEGPQTDKGSGDRYSTKSCASGTAVDGCTSGTSNNNTEYDPAGYFWLVRVQPGAVGKTIDLQLYDPEFASQGPACENLPDAANWGTGEVNPYANDAKKRYSDPASSGSNSGISSTGSPFCSGDYFPGGGTTGSVTSFALRQQTDTLNPRVAGVQTDTNGKACIKQYVPQSTSVQTGDLTNGSSTYDDQLASVFHNWTSLCKFTPDRAGDYYLQVRSNVTTSGGTSSTNTKGNPAMIFSGNTNVLAAAGNTTSGYGDNSFGIRAVAPTGSEKQVAVSGYDRMPIFINSSATTAKFNLIRILPGGAGKSIAFSYFDAGDVSTTSTGTGSVRVIPPADATGTVDTTPFPRGGCKASGGYAGAGPTATTNCLAPFTTSSNGGSNNGKLESIIIPIPDDYTCDYTVLSNCWYQVEVKFPTGYAVTDITTWTASVFGEPVRLVE